MTEFEAKTALIRASADRDLALEAWPSSPMVVTISGFLNANSYAREWKAHDDKINAILSQYPELRHDHQD